MTCTLDRPDAQTLFNTHLNLFSNTVLGGGTVVPESNEWYAVSVNYAVAESMYAAMQQALNELDPRKACCDNLLAMAANDGVYPRPAQFAQGYVKLTGTAGAALPVPMSFTVGSLTYSTASEPQQPTAIGADGTAVIRVRSQTAGTAGNQTLPTGTIVTPIAGVNTTVEVCGSAFCNGAEAEDCEVFRSRYLRRKTYQPRALNKWIQDKFLEWPCATRAFIRSGSCCSCGQQDPGCVDCGCQDCGGKLEYYVMFDGSFPCGIAPLEVVADLTEWMFGSPQGFGLGQVEVGVCGRVVPVTPIMVNVFIDVEDCLTSGQIEEIKSVVTDYFTTVEPSHPVRTRAIEGALVSILGPEVNYAARVELVNGSDNAFVENYGCDVEPLCDYMLCLNELTVTRPDSRGACS